MKLLTDPQLQAFDRHLDAACRPFVRDINSDLLGDRLLDYVRFGGKRIRPQLVLWTFEHAVDPADAAACTPPAAVPSAVFDVAAAWELFHAFLLVHDDIIDGSDRRRDRASLHRQLQGLDSDSPRFGANLGIVAGDLFYAWANRLLSELVVPPAVFRDLHRLFARVATTTGVGQAVDVLQSHAPLDRRDEETLLQEYHWKTAAYTFEGPMLSAAILAGLDAAAFPVISRYALALGQAYQMQNDLLDLMRPAAEGCDLVEGKHTFTLLKARQSLGGRERDDFDRDLARIVADEGRALTLAESVRGRLLRTTAVASTVERIDQLLRSCLADVDVLPPRLHQAMAGCLARLRSSYFVTPGVL